MQLHRVPACARASIVYASGAHRQTASFWLITTYKKRSHMLSSICLSSKRPTCLMWFFSQTWLLTVCHCPPL